MSRTAAYITRYIDLLYNASQDYPNEHSQALFGAESTCLSRIREVRKYLQANITLLQDPWTDKEKTNIGLLNFWTKDGMLYAGSSVHFRKKKKEPNKQLAATLAARITKPITIQDAKALIYVLERELITLPISIHKPSKEVLDYVMDTTSQLQNTGCNYNKQTNKLTLI